MLLDKINDIFGRYSFHDCSIVKLEQGGKQYLHQNDIVCVLRTFFTNKTPYTKIVFSDVTLFEWDKRIVFGKRTCYFLEEHHSLSEDGTAEIRIKAFLTNRHVEETEIVIRFGDIACEYEYDGTDR